MLEDLLVSLIPFINLWDTESIISSSHKALKLGLPFPCPEPVVHVVLERLAVALHQVKSTPWLPAVEALKHSSQKILNDTQETTYQTKSKEQQFGDLTKKQKGITPSAMANTFLSSTLKTNAFGVKSTTITTAELGTLFDQLP